MMPLVERSENDFAHGYCCREEFFNRGKRILERFASLNIGIVVTCVGWIVAGQVTATDVCVLHACFSEFSCPCPCQCPLSCGFRCAWTNGQIYNFKGRTCSSSTHVSQIELVDLSQKGHRQYFIEGTSRVFSSCNSFQNPWSWHIFQKYCVTVQASERYEGFYASEVAGRLFEWQRRALSVVSICQMDTTDRAL